ncbi:MAG: acyl carrier protein [Chloroflexi bacterium]|nr:acyl carrier protein [Chloroflexota bacterium]
MDLTEIKTKLKQFIVTEIINDPDYTIEDEQSLIKGGVIDSFALAQIGVYVEEEFGIYIPDDDLTVENLDTINQMAQRVSQG